MKDEKTFTLEPGAPHVLYIPPCKKFDVDFSAADNIPVTVSVMSKQDGDAAVNDRDSLRLPPTAVSLPRSSIYTSTAQQSLLSMWTPRLIAVGLFIAFVVVVLLLFHA